MEGHPHRERPALDAAVAAHRLRDRHRERRRNVKAIAIALAILIPIGLFAYRPATLIGVHGDALAHSIGRGHAAGDSSCSSLGDSRWRCQIATNDPSSGGAVTYLVAERSFGCWTARRVRAAGGPERRHPERKSGCIDLIDVLT